MHVKINHSQTTLYSNSALLVLNGTSLDTLMPFWLLTDNINLMWLSTYKQAYMKPKIAKRALIHMGKNLNDDSDSEN